MKYPPAIFTERGYNMLYRITTAFKDGLQFVRFQKEENVKDWYYAGASLMRYCKRHGIYLTLTIEDEYTHEPLLRFYHMPYGGIPVARLNGGCKYGGQNRQGITY